MHKIMFSAGEVSGDMHGASLAAAIKKIEPEAKLFGFGGNQMQQAGVDIRFDMKEYNVMGFWEVLKNLRRMFRLRDALVQVMEEERPDLLVLIDYPDFNWRLAAKAKKLGIPVFSYIPPSAWAWRKGRAKPVAKMADQIAAIFPFETKVYEDAGARIEFVGNPLTETVHPSMEKAEAAKLLEMDLNKQNVLLLPGSRRQEVHLLLPEMLAAAKALQQRHPDMDFFLPAAPGIEKTWLEEMIRSSGISVQIKDSHLYDLMHCCDFALATSGTVTLEAALIGLPSVVLYKMSPISYFIGNLLVHLPNFSLPNIIAGERILPELLQKEITTGRIVEAAETMLRGTKSAAELQQKLRSLRDKLHRDDAAGYTAALILETADRCAAGRRILEDHA